MILTILWTLSVVFTTTNAIAAVRYVMPTSTGTGDGSSWMNASGNLQAMINASVSGDEVWVAAGTYKPNAYPVGCSGCFNMRDYTFQLKNGVKVYGGFAGTEALLIERNISANETILSGDFNNDDIITGSGSTLSITGNTENAYHVVISVLDNADTVFDGFTVSGGNANGELLSSITLETHIIYKEFGGGMHNYYSSPIVNNCTFTGNSTLREGGGIYNRYNSSPIVTNCNFIDNLSMFKGGVMCNRQFSSPTVSSCIFSGNRSGSGSGMFNADFSSPTVSDCIFANNFSIARGSGIANQDSDPIVSNCIFINNTANIEGGGMSNYYSSPTVINCTFSENSATSSGGGMTNEYSSPSVFNCTFSNNVAIDFSGGGMYNLQYSNPIVSNCNFINNAANNGGGMLNSLNSSPLVINCTFLNNVAYNYSGGGLNNVLSSPTVVNCVFVENSAFYKGGGLFNNNESFPIITNCTFTGNSANIGGGIANTLSSPIISNCILWGNSTEIEGDTATVTYSIVEGGYAGVGNLNTDPQFVDATNPAGLDDILGTVDDGIRLQVGSPAINAGDNSVVSETTDILGLGRILDGTVDIGAYESGNFPCFDLINAAPPAVIGSESTCSGCGLGDGVINPPATACPMGTVVKYSTDNGDTWSNIPPIYNQTSPLTILTRCECFIDETVVSPTSSITTTPGICTPIVANISGDTTGCGSVTLFASDGSDFVWSGGNNVNSSTNTFTVSDTYTVTITGFNGCTASSSETVNITPNTTNTTIESVCDNYTWSVTGESYNTSGIYTDVTGCHTEVLDITITTSTSNTTTQTACDSFTWSVNGATYFSSNIYIQITDCHTDTLDLTITGACPDCLGFPGGSALPGTPCDDGNQFTENDVYDADCICAGIITEVQPISAEEQFSTLTVSPNPIYEKTTITFTIPKPEQVTLSVYDISGKEVAVLFNVFALANTACQFIFDTTSLSNGTYYAVLKHEDGSSEQISVMVIR
jgi:hypothetical protein